VLTPARYPHLDTSWDEPPQHRGVADTLRAGCVFPAASAAGPAPNASGLGLWGDAAFAGCV